MIIELFFHTFDCGREIATRVVPGVNGKAVNKSEMLRDTFPGVPFHLPPHQKTSIINMEKYCISIDWLQTFNHAEPIAEGTYHDGTETYDVQKLNHETPLFLDTFQVTSRGIPVATILQRPRTTVMHPRSTTLKLENRILYSTRYIEILYTLNRLLKLQYKGITRLDICYDCNALHGGRDVPRFLRTFMTAEPLQKGHIIRSGSSRFTAHGTRSATSVANITSMRWGSPNNAVTSYCYDKTLEMIEVKRKPWILDTWEANGLQYDIDEESLSRLTEKQRKRKTDNGQMSAYIRKHVWRFEISITAKGKDIINMSTGELFRLSPRYLEHRDAIARLFYLYAARVFDFRINDGCTRLRDYRPLQIFEKYETPTAKPHIVSTSADTGRTEKICYNKLRSLLETYGNYTSDYSQSIQKALEFLQVISGVKLATARARQQTDLLASMKATQFIEQPEKIYLQTLSRLTSVRSYVDPEILYNYIFCNPALAEIMLQEYTRVPPPPPDLTPDEYTW